MTIFFIIISVIILLIFMIICSTLKIDIQKLEILNNKIKDLKLKISLSVFGKIDYLKIIIDENKVNKLKNNPKIAVLNKNLRTKLLRDYKNIKDISLNNIKESLTLLKNMKVENINIEAKIGTEDVILTAYIVSAISIILSLLIRKKLEKSRYEILPIYIDKNYLKLSINCIISIRLVHIINILNKLKRKEVQAGDGRTINRRPYVNSNG